RRAGAAAVAALVVGGIVALATSGGGSRPVPEGGSSFRAAKAAHGHRAGTLLDALAPLLAAPRPRGAVLAARAHSARPLAVAPDRAAAQLFLVGFSGTTADASFFQRLRVRDWGGVMLDHANYASPQQLAVLAGQLRA